MPEIIATYSAQQIDTARALRDECKRAGRNAYLTRTPGRRGVPDSIHVHADSTNLTKSEEG